MPENGSNQDTFRNCLADIVVAELAPVPDTAQQRRQKRDAKKWRRNQSKDAKHPPLSSTLDEPSQPILDPKDPTDETYTNDAEDLAEFVEYLADEMFSSLPAELRELDYTAIRNDENLAAAYTVPLPLSTLEELANSLPGSTLDSLQAYNLITSEDQISLQQFLRALLTSYVAVVTAPPSNLLIGEAKSHPSACEICGRDWIPLTYHHLIPRAVHAKVLKRGWHEEWRLNSVAWLCRACHSMVHRIATNEELAREYWSVELLLQRDDLQNFAGWIGGVRWKKR